MGDATPVDNLYFGQSCGRDAAGDAGHLDQVPFYAAGTGYHPE